MRIQNLRDRIEYRVWEEPTLFSINVFTWAFKEFDKKSPWEKWTKDEKERIREHFNITTKSFPGFLNKLNPGNTRHGDNGLFKAIVKARECGWILSQKNINLNINEFVDYSDCWMPENNINRNG